MQNPGFSKDSKASPPFRAVRLRLTTVLCRQVRDPDTYYIERKMMISYTVIWSKLSCLWAHRLSHFCGDGRSPSQGWRLCLATVPRSRRARRTGHGSLHGQSTKKRKDTSALIFLPNVVFRIYSIYRKSFRYQSQGIENMQNMMVAELEPGRCFLGRLHKGADLVETVQHLCVQQGVAMGVFSMIGAVTSVTLGAYDQEQQVYVTFRREGPFEIVHCTGNVSLKNGDLLVHAHGVFAEMDGKTFGGHVFAKTCIYAGEIFLKELLGKPLERRYDKETGLYLWAVPPGTGGHDTGRQK